MATLANPRFMICLISTILCLNRVRLFQIKVEISEFFSSSYQGLLENPSGVSFQCETTKMTISLKGRYTHGSKASRSWRQNEVTSARVDIAKIKNSFGQWMRGLPREKHSKRSRAPRATNLVSAAGTAVHGPCWEKAVRFGFVYQQPPVVLGQF